jgi:vitamin B12 transporter
MDGRRLLLAQARCYCFPPLYFLCLNIPTGTFGIIRKYLMQTKSKIFAAILCAVSSVVYAATDETLGEIVVTATRLEQPLNQSLSSTTVITAEDIRNSHVPDVPSILKSIAGVEIAQNGGIGQSSSLFMRGTNSDQVLVLVDGVRIDSATTGSTPLDQLMIDQIDHIEVVRGNVSSLYGSSAIGGVVQIFTKRGSGEPAFNANAGAGSQNTLRASAGFGGKSNGTDFNVQVSRLRTDGIPAINSVIMPTVNPSKDGYDNNSFSANVHHAFNSDNSLSASMFQSQGNAQYANPYGLPTDVNTTTSTISKFSLASDNRFNEIWTSKLQLADGVNDSKFYLNGQPDPNGYHYETTNRQLTWQNNLRLDTNNSVLLGAERLNQQVASDTLYNNNERSANSLFGGYTGTFGAHQMQANLRQDHYSDFGTANTGLLGYGYKLNESWRATTSYSTAFKAPTFNDLYYPLSYGYQGNPNLQPERSHNTEVGIHYAESGQRVDVVYFNNDISDLIAINNAGTTVVNINRASISGAELNYAGHFGNTGVKAAITSQDPRDDSTGQILLRRARLHSSLGLTQQMGDWQMGGEWLYSSSRQDNFTDPTSFVTTPETLASYNVFNLTAGYAFSKKLKFMARADNLTNQNDSNIYGYNPLGRRVFASINYQP